MPFFFLLIVLLLFNLINPSFEHFFLSRLLSSGRSASRAATGPKDREPGPGWPGGRDTDGQDDEAAYRPRGRSPGPKTPPDGGGPNQKCGNPRLVRERAPKQHRETITRTAAYLILTMNSRFKFKFKSFLCQLTLELFKEIKKRKSI